MTNKMYYSVRRLLACLLALLCVLSIGAAGGLHAWADDTGEEVDPSAEAPVSGPYSPVNLGANCHLNVYPISANSEFAEDLTENAAMTVDAYKVADAAAIPGIDSYGYQFIAPFNTDALLAEAAKGMDVRTQDGAYIPNENLTNEIWDTISQEAAKIVKGSASVTPAASSVKAEGDEYASVPLSETAFLPTGLYLLIVHTDSSGYWNEEKEGEPLTTKVLSDGYIYSYAPQIVTLPYKSTQMQPYDKDKPVKTSDNTPWVYHLSVYLKAERQGRKAELTIKKTLHDYKGTSEMEFVFHVDATVKKGDKEQKVFSKAYSLMLKENGEAETEPIKLPVGATVTISEDYSGAACEPDGTTKYTGVMTPEGLDTGEEVLNPVPFVNKGKNNNNGGGIENTFEFTQSTGDSGYWKFIPKNVTPETES